MGGFFDDPDENTEGNTGAEAEFLAINVSRTGGTGSDEYLEVDGAASPAELEC
jgi:hypothetical protein